MISFNILPNIVWSTHVVNVCDWWPAAAFTPTTSKLIGRAIFSNRRPSTVQALMDADCEGERLLAIGSAFHHPEGFLPQTLAIQQDPRNSTAVPLALPQNDVHRKYGLLFQISQDRVPIPFGKLAKTSEHDLRFQNKEVKETKLGSYQSPLRPILPH